MLSLHNMATLRYFTPFSPSFYSPNSILRSRKSLFSYCKAVSSLHGILYAHKRRCFSSEVELTSVRYHVQRGNYSKVTDKDIATFERILPGRVTTNPDDIAPHNTDWLKTVRGQSQVLLKPKTTAEVSEILKYCNTRRIAVNPQGGNTGLVGGSVPVFDEIILSLSNMNNIIDLDEVSGIFTCEAGCILENVDSFLADKGFVMPLDLGAKGSCQIGGNLATNAGGIRMIRYGSLHGSVLGLEAVLANGTIVDCLSKMRKDNTGYDIKQLFIGSEGTLGVITKAAILAPSRPKSINVAFLACDSFESVLETFQTAKSLLGEILSACEFLDDCCMTLVEKNLGMHNPTTKSPFYVLIETSGSNGTHDEEKLNLFLENVMSKGIVQNGTLATDMTKIHEIWKIRESIAESLTHEGYSYKYDMSLPITKLYDLVPHMRGRLGPEATNVVGYGHLGDGNLHFNVTSKEHSKDIMHELEPYIYEWTAQYNGSISAEHGLGFKKAGFIHLSKSREAIDMMKQLKVLFDPNGILNPYKTVVLG